MSKYIKIFVVIVIVLSLSTGCAWSIGKKGLQSSTGIATANSEGDVSSQGFSEGGVEVMTHAIEAVSKFAVSILRFVLPAGLSIAPLEQEIPEHSHPPTSD